LVAIESNREDTTSVKKMFLKRDEVSGEVPKDFHTLDYQNCFVSIEVNVLMKQQFSVEDESEVFPSVFGLQNWATDI